MTVVRVVDEDKRSQVAKIERVMNQVMYMELKVVFGKRRR